MKEMKDSGVSWIGEIPADWEVRRIKYVAQCSNEKAPYAGQRYIGLENIESWAGKIVGVTETSSIESTVSSFSEAFVLFAKLRPYLAKAALPDFSGQCSAELLVK